MEPFNRNEMRELLVGTWIGVALIVEGLVHSGMIAREDLVVPLSQAEALAKDQRRVALTALRRLIEHGFGAEPDATPGAGTWPDAAQRA